MSILSTKPQANVLMFLFLFRYLFISEYSMCWYMFSGELIPSASSPYAKLKA